MKVKDLLISPKGLLQQYNYVHFFEITKELCKLLWLSVRYVLIHTENCLIVNNSGLFGQKELLQGFRVVSEFWCNTVVTTRDSALKKTQTVYFYCFFHRPPVNPFHTHFLQQHLYIMTISSTAGQISSHGEVGYSGVICNTRIPPAEVKCGINYQCLCHTNSHCTTIKVVC